jgi:hypothetical protein
VILEEMIIKQRSESFGKDSRKEQSDRSGRKEKPEFSPCRTKKGEKS